MEEEKEKDYEADGFEARIREHLDARANSAAWARHLALVALAAVGVTAYFVWRARHPEAPAEKDKAAAAASVDLSRLRNHSESFLPDPAPVALPEPTPTPPEDAGLVAMASPAPAAAIDGARGAAAAKDVEAAEDLLPPSSGAEFSALPLPAAPAPRPATTIDLPPERDALAMAAADGLRETAPALTPLPGAGALPGADALAAAVSPAAAPGDVFHVIVEDDSLPDLAARYYGSASAANVRRLRDANPCLRAGGFRPGVRLRIPAATGKAAASQPVAAKPAAPAVKPTAAKGAQPAAAPERTPAAAATCVVRPGDTLSRIAARHCGRPAAWKEIYALNRDQLSSPEALRPGMVLRLPPEP